MTQLQTKPFGGGGRRDDAGCSWKEPVSFAPTELQNLFSHSEDHQCRRTIKSFKRTFFGSLVRKLFAANWQMLAACWLASSPSREGLGKVAVFAVLLAGVRITLV